MLGGGHVLVKIAGGMAGAVFIGYCVYFDKQRRADPNHKKNVRERRVRLQQAKAEEELSNRKDDTSPLAIFVKDNVEIGMAMITQGSIENGLRLMANAFIICNHNQQLYMHLQNLLPPSLLYMMMTKVGALHSNDGVEKIDD